MIFIYEMYDSAMFINAYPKGTKNTIKSKSDIIKIQGKAVNLYASLMNRTSITKINVRISRDMVRVSSRFRVKVNRVNFMVRASVSISSLWLIW